LRENQSRTYSDEQRAKENWGVEVEAASRRFLDKRQDAASTLADNPYAALPRMVLLTYQLPPSIRDVALGGEFDEFDLNVFFAADGEGALARFKYQDEVQKWLDLIRGALAETTVDNLKLGAKKPPLPFADARLLPLLAHTFWFLPTVASCHAMRNLLQRRQNTFYRDYNVVVAAGSRRGQPGEKSGGVHQVPPRAGV